MYFFKMEFCEIFAADIKTSTYAPLHKTCDHIDLYPVLTDKS